MKIREQKNASLFFPKTIRCETLRLIPRVGEGYTHPSYQIP